MDGAVQARERAANIAALLRAWSEGDQSALEKLTPIIYDELHRLACHYMNRERPGHSLQPTALVNEVYLRLLDYRHVKWQDRAHFFAVCGQAMRRILVEHARRHNVKRGGDVRHVSLTDTDMVGACDRFCLEGDLVALDDALHALAQIDRRKVRVIEMRFFVGLTEEETAEVLKVSPLTVKRDWRAAKAWLYRELSGGNQHGPGMLETS